MNIFEDIRQKGEGLGEGGGFLHRVIVAPCAEQIFGATSALSF